MEHLRVMQPKLSLTSSVDVIAGTPKDAQGGAAARSWPRR